MKEGELKDASWWQTTAFTPFSWLPPSGNNQSKASAAVTSEALKKMDHLDLSLNKSLL